MPTIPYTCPTFNVVDAYPAPFHFADARDGMVCGLPEDRLARMAARRAFVEMKTCFMRATAEIEGSTGVQLQRKVRQAGELVELWRMRHAVLAALPLHKAEAQIHRQELLHQLDNAFPEG